MSAYVNLQRQFRDLTSAELENPDVLATLNDYKIGGGIDWPALLTHRRVVILAEAGAGKTREMEERAKRLVCDGQFAFFVPLESLEFRGGSITSRLRLRCYASGS
jgi:hypothetical protein